MSKSDHGLPARSGATQMQISREHYELQWMLARKYITFEKYKKALEKLKKLGKA
jgi:hypothetical protein